MNSQNMDLFKALPKDAEALTKISIASKRHWDYPEEWIQLWMDGLTISPEYIIKNYVFKLIDNNEIIGFCAIEEEDSYFEISHLWIKPQYIGKGFGYNLCKQTLENVLDKGEEIRVLADPNAVSFYQKVGFKEFDQLESLPKGRFLPYMKMTF